MSVEIRDRELIEELCEIEDGLTSWEVGFIEDMAQKALDNPNAINFLTGGQRAKAMQILEEKG